MSRHHTLPPIIHTPAPPKPKETRRRRRVGSAQGTHDIDEADETTEATSATHTAFSSPSPPSIEPPERRIPSTTGKLSSDTLKTMLEAQEQDGQGVRSNE